jgi:hypothetical protein
MVFGVVVLAMGGEEAVEEKQKRKILHRVRGKTSFLPEQAFTYGGLSIIRRHGSYDGFEEHGPDQAASSRARARWASFG